MKSRTRLVHLFVALFIMVVAFTMMLQAQDTSKTTTTSGHGTKQVKVESGEIVYINGNQLIVKMADGQLRHITVPPGATAMVDGKPVGIKDAKVGMKLQKTITTTTTPKTITTTRTISGKVFYVQPPNWVILSLPGGENKRYKVPPNQVFMINGQKQTVFDLRKGMDVEATVLTEVPETVVTQQAKVTGSMPPPPPPPPAENAILVEEVVMETPAPAAAPAPVQQAAAKEPSLPKTGSELPLIGLLGVLSLIGSGALRAFRQAR